MRCMLSSRKVIQLRKKLNMRDIHHATVRGGSDHEVLLCMDDGTCKVLKKDGTVRHSGFGRWRYE